ncbi:DNA-directed RNA polymerase III largest subunit (RPC homologue), putative [Theileria annulata]|uniref:DNA-directed RNA polymerase subunit n=1 Tax=Theileria annulata TaxID=5874 RepID=Q4U940_THEAN|nr:DNA-directed RNA polymerase III largest subunit (RPC homologue), putative [Theileria annulata]CAI76663.1 DNA-directed RNA polymerase III largest subunit (RPC homologue), putative [Theileria annulata]|eukprot:XP_953288.1 DNA-directed RNA polymerase III largest subunit (RPC homologue), putative [Theileria annulata]
MVAPKRQKVKQEVTSSTKEETSTSNKGGFDFLEIYNKYESANSKDFVKSEPTKKAEIVKSSSFMMEAQTEGFLRKEYVLPSTNKTIIDSLQFDVMASSDISRASEIEIEHKQLYLINSRKPCLYGPLDSRLGCFLMVITGCNNKDAICETCGKGYNECVGHWGHIKLALPVFHIGFFKYTIQILYCICKKCSSLLLSEESIKKFYELHKKAQDDPVLKPLIFKNIVQDCKKISKCPRCQSPQGVIKKIVKPIIDQFMKLKHIVKYKESGKMKTVEEELNPLVVKHLFENIDPVHSKVLNIVHPEKLIISNLPAPPNCIRPSVSVGEEGTTEDDLTCIFSDIVESNNQLKSYIKNGAQTNSFIVHWQIIQYQCTRFINSDSPALAQLLLSRRVSKPGRGIFQRLKGKEGRFRGNLSGKRVDFSARTVISPDPNVGIDEVVVPEWIARRLTFPERVTKYNIHVLKKAILNGVSVWPGASYVNKLDGSKCSLRFANPKHMSENLQVGDIVERHLWNGDIVIFNRQPSLHRLSIMCHRARVMSGSTFRFNECVCLPYNADFDGDEMNLHLPQTYEARAEALHLLSVLKNLTTPRNGEPLIAPVQDFLCASYLLTSKDMFLNRSEFSQVISYFTDGTIQVDLPPPSIIHPVTLWTGKQVFSVLIKPNNKSKVMVNIRVREREYTDPNQYYKNLNKDNLEGGKVENTKSQTSSNDVKPVSFMKLDDCMCPSDGYVVIYKSELMCGSLGVRSLGASKGGLFYELMLKNSPKISSECMLRVSKLSSRWLSEFGMTIGLDDVTPSKELIDKKKQLLLDGYSRVDEAISNFQFLQPYPGCTREQTLELQVKSILDELRNESGKICTSLLNPDNKPLIMFNSGAKGALINIAQMVACVGQQNVSGQRIQNGFIGRTLPHFTMGCKDAKSRGFVANSFFTGLEPEEFFFHTMSGREGLIDTAVKTSETGYMQRRLMKVMEDLSVCYDYSVRTSDGQIVQFLYGDDGLSSLSKSCFTNLKSSLDHIKHINPINKQLIFTSSHIDPTHLDNQEQGPSKRRNKLKRSGTNTNKERKCTQDSKWILPPKNVEELLEKVDSLLMDKEFVSKLPPQIKNKVASYIHWIKPTETDCEACPEKDRRKFLERLDSRQFSRAKSVDDNIINTFKNHIVAYFSVYVENSYSRRNVPLFPCEIEAWTKFLQPLLVELLPPTIYNHSCVSQVSDYPYSYGIGSVYEFGNTIERVLMEHSEKIALVLDKKYEQVFESINTESQTVIERFKLVNTVNRISLEQMFEFIRYSWKDYQKSLCEPGEAIGALGSQSIGEPATQMTLKTFHFAGVASMNVTLGVPRIQEIINATSLIATPIIEVPLEDKTSYEFALKVKSKIEKTTLGQICLNIKQLYTPQNSKLLFTLNRNLIEQLHLEINSNKFLIIPDFYTHHIYTYLDIIIETGSFGKVKIPKNSVYSIGDWQICIELPSNQQHFFQQNALISGLTQLVVAGYKSIKRAVIKRESTPQGPNYQIAVEGYGLQEVMGSYGVMSSAVKSNHVSEVAKVLGIEAARSVIISEIQKCMDAYSIDIDCRYMKLLGDVMTFRGEVVGINRFGIQKMRSSALMLASFEETNDHLLEAALHHRRDPIKGVSECIIMGKPISLGTGSFDILMSN